MRRPPSALLAAVFGTVAAGAVLLPLAASGVDRAGYASLAVAIIGWFVVAPLAGVATVAFAAHATVRALRERPSSVLRRLSAIAAWAGAALALGALFAWSAATRPPLLAVAVGLVAVAAGVGTIIVIAFAGIGRPRTRVVRLVSVGGAVAVVVAAASYAGVQTARVAEYEKQAGVVRFLQPAVDKFTAEGFQHRAAACLGIVEARALLDRTTLVVDGVRAGDLPPGRLADITAAVAKGRTTLEAFDPAPCRADAALLTERLRTRGKSPEDYAWLGFGASDAYRDAGMAAEPADPPSASFLTIDEATVARMRAQAERSRRDHETARDAAVQATELYDTVYDAAEHPLVGPGIALAKIAPASAEAIIAQTGSEGIPEAAALRSRSEDLRDTGADDLLDRLEAYVQAAAAMPGR